MGTVIFGAALREFSSVWESLQTLIAMTTGEYGLATLSAVSPNSAFAYYFVYLVLVLFILVNAFLAVIVDSYRCLQGTKVTVPPNPFRLTIWQEEKMAWRRWRAARRVRQREVRAQEAAAQQEAAATLARRIALLGEASLAAQRLQRGTRRQRCKRACCARPCERVRDARASTQRGCEGCCTQTEQGSCRRCHRCRGCWCFCGCWKWWYCGCRRCGLNRTDDELAAIAQAHEAAEIKLLQEPFFLSSVELQALLTDPQTIGHKRVGQLMEVPPRKGEIQLAPVRERCVGYEHLLALGWPQAQVAWLLFQVGELDYCLPPQPNLSRTIELAVNRAFLQAEEHPSFKASTNARNLSSIQNTLNRSVSGLMGAVEKLAREVEVLRFDMATGKYSQGDHQGGDVSRPWTDDDPHRPKTPMQEMQAAHKSGEFLIQAVHDEFRTLETSRPVSREISPDDPSVGHFYRDFNTDPEGSSRPVSRALSPGAQRPFTPAIDEAARPVSRGIAESKSRPVSRQFLRHLTE